MGQIVDAKIRDFQEQAGIEPATGSRAESLSGSEIASLVQEQATHERRFPFIPPLDWEDTWYRECVRRGIFGMFSREGDAAVAAVVAKVRMQMAEGVLATPGASRAALQLWMWNLDEERFDEKDDSEVWIHLTYAFEDIIPEDVWWRRGWLQSGMVGGSDLDKPSVVDVAGAASGLT